jgi:hypothetical protein
MTITHFYTQPYDNGTIYCSINSVYHHHFNILSSVVTKRIQSYDEAYQVVHLVDIFIVCLNDNNSSFGRSP